MWRSNTSQCRFSFRTFVLSEAPNPARAQRSGAQRSPIYRDTQRSGAQRSGAQSRYIGSVLVLEISSNRCKRSHKTSDSEPWS